MIEFVIDDTDYREWTEYARGEFLTMAQTLIDVAEMIDLNTRPLVPVREGDLRRSFKYVITERSSDFIELELGYDAIDPKNDFHYALVQHERTDFNHPRGGEAFYLFKGIKSSIADAFEMIETDYLSLFGR